MYTLKTSCKKNEKVKSVMYQDALYLSQNLIYELYEQDSAIML